jgi:NAD(P)-dependent dehydrogenase (short-subunit alcohol dehydrogenase family)
VAAELADMTGRVCVITGATRGIGRATAEGLARLGATLVLVVRRREVGAAVARALRHAHAAPPAEVVSRHLHKDGAARGGPCSGKRRPTGVGRR